MASGKISIEIDGDELKAVQAYANLSDEQRKLVDGIGRVGKAAEDAADKSIQAARREQKERADQVRLADRLVKANRTVEETYKDELKALIKARKDGQITTEKYRTTVDRLKRKLRETRDETANIETTNKKAFGTSAIGQVTKYAASFASVAAAVGVVREAIQKFNEEKQQALGSTDSLVEARTSLRQISRGDFDRLESRSDKLTEFGIDRVQARELVFAARSTGFEGEEATVARANAVIPVEAAAKFAGEFRQQFSNDNLKIEEAFDTALTAAEQSVYNINQLLPQIQKAAQGAKGIGASSSDVAAVTSVFAGQFGEAAGRRVRSLEENILAFNKENTELRGLDLIESIQRLGQDRSLRDSFVGENKELATAVNAAVNSLQDFTLDGKRVAGILNVDRAIERAQRKDVRILEGKIRESVDPSTTSGRIEASRQNRIAAKAREEIENELYLSEEAASAEAFRSRVRASQDRRARGLESVAGGGVVGGVVRVGNMADNLVTDSVTGVGNTLGVAPVGQAGILNAIQNWAFGSNPQRQFENIKAAVDSQSQKQTQVLERIAVGVESQPQLEGL